MTEDNYNRMILFYQQQGAYLYGCIQVVKGSQDNLITSNPFIISKTLSGQEIVYGSVLESIEKVIRIISRYMEQQQRAVDSSIENGLLGPKPQYRNRGDGYVVVDSPDSVPDEEFNHARELEAEDMILLSSIHLRTLSEAFSGKFNQSIPLYNYDGQECGDVLLKDIFNAVLHHRYFVIRGEFMIDLFSHKCSLDPNGSFGSKVDLYNFLDGVIAAINSIKVKDYMGMLRSKLNRLSVESESKDMIFAIQNIESLNRVVRDRMENNRTRELLHTMFDPIAKKLFKKIPRPASGQIIDIPFRFTEPRFKIADDLSNLRIEIHVTVNDVKEVVKVDYRKLLTQIAQVYGRDTLIPVKRRRGTEAN